MCIRDRGYYIYRANLNEPLKLVGTIKDRFATHYLDDGLNPATTYRYAIKTFGQNGISADGIVVSASTSKGVETVSFAQAIYGLPERVKLIWRPHANLKVGSYIIERRKDEKSSWSKKAEVKGRLSAEYIDNSVKSGEMYQYRIRVKTLDGDISEPSNVLTAQTKELPLGVINLQATIDQPKKIILTWDSPLNEAFSHYQIYTSRGSILPLVPLAKTDKNSYEDLINANGARRYYKVTLVDKANVLETSQLWREVVADVAKKYEDVRLDYMYVDNAAMQLIKDPKQFDVLLTENLFGDILSDEASMICGSIGLLPSASIGGKVGIFEPIHGSAPDIAKQGIANPIATILSAAMMLKYAFGEHQAAKTIEEAVKKALKDGYRTKDIANYEAKEVCTTGDMGSIISNYITDDER